MALKDKKVLFIGLISLSSILGMVLIAILSGWFYFYSTAPSTAMVYIYPNTSTKAIEDTLKAHLGADFARKTMRLANFTETDWSKRTGAYKIDKGMNTIKAMRKLTHGAQTPIKLTFNNVRTINELAEKINDKFLMTDTAFLKAIENKATLQKMGCDTNDVRVIFFPDTYEFYWNISPDKLVNDFYSYYTKWWNKERKDEAKALGLTPQQVSIVASIVEEETNDKAERGMVARLYINRVQKGMKLQADPTVKYALNDFTLKRIGGANLFVDSPYNTYKYAGLPPGPIRLPEKATIETVLKAPKHDYIYMCAKEDFSGRHNFTATYSEHQVNAKKYQKALNERGIK